MPDCLRGSVVRACFIPSHPHVCHSPLFTAVPTANSIRKKKNQAATIANVSKAVYLVDSGLLSCCPRVTGCAMLSSKPFPNVREQVIGKADLLSGFALSNDLLSAYSVRDH